MLREHRKLIDALHCAATLALVILAYAFMHSVLVDDGHPLLTFDRYMPAIWIIGGLVVLSMNQTDFSASAPLVTPLLLAERLAACFFLGLIGFFSTAYVFKLQHLSRLFLVGGAALAYVASYCWHLCVLTYYQSARSRGSNQKSLLLVGNSFTLPAVLEALDTYAGMGLRPVAVLSTDTLDGLALPKDVKAGGIKDIKEMLDSTVIDCAIFSSYRQEPQLIEKSMLVCQERGIEVWLKMDFLHQEVAVSRVDYLHNIPIFIFSLGPRDGVAILVKRLVDVIVSAALLALLALPMAVVALLIPLFNPGPVLFRQRRIGLNGREFVLNKFRSMHIDAETRKEQYALKNEMKGPVFKMHDDPRVTAFGRWLRKYSIDELPQLWNVLIGEMSLIGPRPPLPSEVGSYTGWQRRRLSMRPGISGLWQVLGRNQIVDFEDWVRLDLKYIDTWSLWLDFRIFGMTILAVLRGTGY